jgi:hypothetical protein
VVHRVQDLVGEAERAVAERLLEEVVGRGDGADQGILDGQAPCLGAAFAHRGHDVARLSARQRDETGPSPARRGFAE